MKETLLLQLRPEDEAADGEYRAFIQKGGLDPARVRRIRLEQAGLPENLDLDDFNSIIVGGGPGCVSDPAEKKTPGEARAEAAMLSLMPAISERDMPFLGCCYGIGILAHFLGGPVTKECYSEPVGSVTCHVTKDGARDPLLVGLPETFDTFVGHKEAVQALPENAVHLMSSKPCPFQMIRYKSNIYATQFHPEADAGVFAERIKIYRDRGYFPPEQAEALKLACESADVTQPQVILRRFVERFS